MSKVLYPNKSEFELLLKNERTIFVDFFATWCGPCKMLGPEIDKLAEEVGDEIKIVKIDIDKERELADLYNVQSIPNLFVFKDGKVIDRQLGYQAYPQLKAMLEK